MQKTDYFKFKVGISEKKYDHKPHRKKDVPYIRFYQIDTNIDDFKYLILKGYCYSGLYKYCSFTMKEKTDDNYVGSYIVSIDFDHINIDMEEMVGNLIYKPTLAYTSCSNGLDGYSFRLLYIFDEIIKGNDEYYNFLYSILHSNNIQKSSIDKRSEKASQYYNGCANANIYLSNIIYKKEDFNIFYKDYRSIYNNSTTKSANKNNILSPHNIILKCTFEDKQFEYDFWNKEMSDILEKYLDIYPNIEHTPLPNVDEDTPYILFPDDYIEIKRYWKKDNNGKPVKITDKNARRNKLFINGIIRRRINPDITFDNLLYNLLFELYNYISNYDAENIIGKKDIYEIAKSVMNADISLIKLKPPNRKYIVNREYCIKYNMSPNQVKRIALKMIRYKQIGELYDCLKTDKENIEIMNENGLKVSLRTLKNWRKDNGISKYKLKDK